MFYFIAIILKDETKSQAARIKIMVDNPKQLPITANLIRFEPAYIDLFAGCGGLSLGLGWAGWKGLLAVEHDAMAFSTLKHNFLDKQVDFQDWPEAIPQEPLDVIEILSNPTYCSELESLKTRISLLAGGPPCQGFSVAGARNGQDERNDLFISFLEYVKLLRPPLVLIENVEGMARPFSSKPRESQRTNNPPFQMSLLDEPLPPNEYSQNKLPNQSFGTVVDEIELYLKDDLGYVPFVGTLTASDYGVPQTRTRLFIFAVREDLACGVPRKEVNLFYQILLIRQAFLRYKNLPVERPVSVYEAMGDLASEKLIPTPDAPGFHSGLYEDVTSTYIELMRHNVLPSSIPDSHRYSNHTQVVIDRYKFIQSALGWGRVPREVLRENGTGKHRVVYLDPELPAPTLTTSPDDFLHFSQPRIITVREMARLQSFPDDFELKGRYTINGPRRKYDRARVSQVGNAVAPFLAEAIGYALLNILSNLERVRISDESKASILER